MAALVRMAALAGASMMLMHCSNRRETVRIPAADGTPPFVALDAVGAGHSLVLSVGRGPEQVELLPRDSIVLIALSEDADGGIKDIALVGNALVTCKDMKSGKSRIRKTGFMRKTVPGSPRITRGPMRRSNRFVLRTGDLAALCRGPGMAFAGAVGQATATTANFSGGHASSPRLEFRLAGGWMPEVPPAAGKKAAPEPALVTSEIPKPVGFMPEGGVGGTEYCPKDAFPTPPACEDATPVPFLTR